MIDYCKLINDNYINTTGDLNLLSDDYEKVQKWWYMCSTHFLQKIDVGVKITKVVNPKKDIV